MLYKYIVHLDWDICLLLKTQFCPLAVVWLFLSISFCLINTYVTPSSIACLKQFTIRDTLIYKFTGSRKVLLFSLTNLFIVWLLRQKVCVVMIHTVQCSLHVVTQITFYGIRNISEIESFIFYWVLLNLHDRIQSRINIKNYSDN